MIYDKYTNRLKNIVKSSEQKRESPNLFEGLGDPLTKATNRIKSIHEQRIFGSDSQLSAQPLSSILHPNSLKNAKIGEHPDFKQIKGTDQTLNHSIVSVFIDIDGSTSLFSKYDLEDNFNITNTIQSAAIHTVIALGGHVQRLQGDGVFAYFGGRSISHQKAVELALTATSMFTYFMDNDLKQVFQTGGVEDIKTKIGIDFGYDADVLWATFGVQEIIELTTLSLHTSLAHKMIQYAERNGINVGKNVLDVFNGDQSLFSIISENERYIYRDRISGFNYSQYRFNWLKFLKSLPFIVTNHDGSLSLRGNGTETTSQSNIMPKRDLSALANLIGSNKPYYGNK